MAFLQILQTVGNNFKDDVSKLFKFEMCSVPSALFESCGLMRWADKPVLTKYLLKLSNIEILQLDQTVEYVLDGGSLLQHFLWKRSMN